MADEQQAYCLTDRGTWLKQSQDATLDYQLDIVCEGNDSLLNQYGVIAVNRRNIRRSTMRAQMTLSSGSARMKCRN